MTWEVHQGEPWGRGGKAGTFLKPLLALGGTAPAPLSLSPQPSQDEGTGKGKAEHLVQSPKAEDVAQADFHPDLVLGMIPNTPDLQTTFQRENNNDSGRLGVPQGSSSSREIAVYLQASARRTSLCLSPAPAAPEPPLRPLLLPCHLKEGSHHLPAKPRLRGGGLEEDCLPSG